MKKYPKHAANEHYELSEAPDGALLEFPVAPDFLSRPPQLDPQVMLRRIEENFAWRNSRPGAEARRLAAKVSEEFIL
jgi:hypothetical protein